VRWHTADFDALSWQGVHVHGFRILDNGDGTAELQLDLDFIVAHPDPGGGPYRLAQAMLQFHEVFALRFALDYVACSAGMSAFAIGGITRVPLRGEDDAREDDAGEDMGPWRWRIDVGWPEGCLEFESTGFSQWLVGEVVEQETQWLAAADRL
jgi:hypothetical protein